MSRPRLHADDAARQRAYRERNRNVTNGGIAFARVFARASAWTFSIRPVRDLVRRYIGDGRGWVDPYAGMNSPAELTNDLNPDSPALYHLDALDFAEQVCTGTYRGVLFDPPYSYRQVKEHYEKAGREVTPLDTSYNFYARVMDPLGARVEPGGYAICCGWNSNGFGKKRGFRLVELLVVAHGLHHNDTLVTVEQKIGEAPPSRPAPAADDWRRPPPPIPRLRASTDYSPAKRPRAID